MLYHTKKLKKERKESCLWEAQTHNLHIIARRSATQKNEKKRKKGKKVVFGRLKLTTFTLQHDALP